LVVTDNDVSFGIGAVSRLTGIPSDTLRIWERRYNAVTPSRTPQNRRRYSRDDVSRLLLIKQLVELGEPVGTIIHLPEAELNQRLMAHAELQDRCAPVEPSDNQPSTLPTVLIFGDVLIHQIRQWSSQLPSLDIIGGHEHYEDFEREWLHLKPDIVILEFPALQAHNVSRLLEQFNKVGGSRVIVVYAFAASSVLDFLEQSGIQALRSPVTPAILASACESTVLKRAVAPAYDESMTRPPRRFSGRDLAVIANLETRLACECPHHLADLVTRVSAFEQYSLDCEVRSPREAALHARLHGMSARARALLEEALGYLLETEDIHLPAEDVSEPGTPMAVSVGIKRHARSGDRVISAGE